MAKTAPEVKKKKERKGVNGRKEENETAPMAKLIRMLMKKRGEQGAGGERTVRKLTSVIMLRR